MFGWITAVILITVVILCLAVLWYLFKLKQQQDFADRVEKAVSLEELDIEARLVNINNKIEVMANLTADLKERMQWLEQQIGFVLNRQKKEAQPLFSTVEAVYQRFDQGKEVLDLAREFGKAQGEIELMLNLRRIRKGG